MSEIQPRVDSARRADELVRALLDGSLRFHQLPTDLTAREAAEIRRRALEQGAGCRLRHVGHYSLDDELAAQRNCENMIGVAQIPMSVVGPLRIVGDHVDDSVYVPLGTTEGALIASINRGCSAIRRAGGARVSVEDVGMTRAPVFRTTGIEQNREFLGWVRDYESEMHRIAAATSRHLRLREIKPFVIGCTIFLRFRFETGDAMGMNMVTIACDRIVQELIEPGTGVSCISLSGNYCVDKKPSAINFQEGRGKRLHAEIVLPPRVLRDCLRTSARTLSEVQYRKNLLGSIAAGAQGYNAHFANVLAAFFIATGQDLAQVVEGSMGVTCIESRGPEEVYASVFLPDVPLGAVGGGTCLGTQQEALALLGVEPDPQRPGFAVLRLAEILAATVLAGELSLMASLTSQDLASAHERLGRGEPGRRQPHDSDGVSRLRP